ncbi:MAG: hypothetical protein Fur0022_00730 [Anaerolineales bacterium]
MKTRMQLPTLCFLLAALLLAACGSQAAASRILVTDYDSLVEALRAAGATVEPADPVSQPFFGPEGQVLKVNGQDVQVFEYPDDAAAERDAETISPDGSSTTTTMITWIDAPHFYKTGKLIVLYVGSEEGTLQLLESVLGPQFAGQ